MPETIPVKEPTEATPASSVLHMPPAVLLLSAMPEPTHTLPGPVIGSRVTDPEFTIIDLVATVVPQLLLTE